MNERVIVERDGVRIFCLHYLQRGGIISIEVEIVFDWFDRVCQGEKPSVVWAVPTTDYCVM